MGDLISLFAPRERTQPEQEPVEIHEPVMRTTLELMERIQLAVRRANRRDATPEDEAVREAALRVYDDIQPFLPLAFALVQHKTLADIDMLPPNERLI